VTQHDLSLLGVSSDAEGCSLPASIGNSEPRGAHLAIMVRPGYARRWQLCEDPRLPSRLGTKVRIRLASDTPQLIAPMSDCTYVLVPDISASAIWRPEVVRESRRGSMGGRGNGVVHVSNPSSPKAKLSGGQKWVIAGLILLQVPASAIFYPVAAVISLTGIGGPLSMILLTIGTMPLSLAMKRKAAWQSGGVLEIGGGSGPRGSSTASLT
jgi:hypothetical protein